MGRVSEVYLRAVAVALKRGLEAKGVVLRFMVGKYEFTFNGTRATVDGIGPFLLKVAEPGAFLPLLLVGPSGGTVAGADGRFEDAVLAALKADDPTDLDTPPEVTP